MERWPYPPRVTAFNRPFWTGLERGSLTTTECRSCGHKTFPPKIMCPECWSEDVHWVTLEGTGWLRSFTEVWVAPNPFRHQAPYTLGLVDLKDGVRLLARIDSAYEDLTPDQAVRLVVHPGDPVPLFSFRPETDAG